MSRLLAIAIALLAARAAADTLFYNAGTKIGPANKVNCGTNTSCGIDGGVVTITATGGAGSGAPTTATYITQTSDATLTNEQALSSLSTGLISVTTGTGVLSNYAGSTCTAGQYANAVNPNGSLVCQQVTGAQVSGAVGTATALAANPVDCGANTYATTIDASGNLTCGQVTVAGISATGSPSSTTYLRGDGTWATPGGAPGLNIYGAGNGTGYAVNVTTPGTTLYSKSATVTAGDRLVQSVIVSVLNNSGGTATYTLNCRIGTTTLVAVSDSTTQAAHASNRGHYRATCEYAVITSSSTLVTGSLERYPSAAAGTSGTGAVRSAWQTSASNWTGSQTFNMNLSSSTATATQTAYVHSNRLEQVQNP